MAELSKQAVTVWRVRYQTHPTACRTIEWQLRLYQDLLQAARTIVVPNRRRPPTRNPPSKGASRYQTQTCSLSEHVPLHRHCLPAQTNIFVCDSRPNICPA